MESRYDVNRDGKVNALDLGAVRANLFGSVTPIQPPAPVAAATRRGDVAGATALLTSP